MTAAFLKWVANLMIGVVMVSTLWLVRAVSPELTPGPAVHLALVAVPVAGAASAATR